MQKPKKFTLAVLIQAALISTAYASEQSEAKGFIEDAEGSVLLRTGFITRDRDNGRTDTSSLGQTAIFDLESGFTPGVIGVGVDVVGDVGFKIGKNRHAGNGMLPLKNDGKVTNGLVDPYDTWGRGGGRVKARISNTTISYGTHVSDLPVLASNTARLVPEYYTGFMVKSREIKDLELVAGKFTKNQYSDQISSDQIGLDRAVFWGASYKFNDQLNASYYGVQVKDLIDRHYLNTSYKQNFANDSSLTYDFTGYYTKFDKNASTASATGYVQEGYDNDKHDNYGKAGVDKSNSIWSISADYNKGNHDVLAAYQQNTGSVGYDYGSNGDGYQSIYIANSYLSDFVGNHEKSVQLRYNYDFKGWNIPGLTWTTAFVYGWDIDARVKQADGSVNIEEGREHEFFNQVKYTVQSGFAKGASLRLRNSMLRSNTAYNSPYMGNVEEWRIFLDVPVTLF